MNLIQKIFEEGSLISIEPKISVKNNDLLSLVYTPGVGEICMAIKDDPTKSDTLTNRANSMIFLSDGSNLPFFDSNFRSDAVLPLLEFYSWQTLNSSKLNAYPIVINHKKINNGSEISEYMKYFEESFICVELVEISEQKINEFINGLDESYNFNILILTGRERKIIEKSLKCSKLTSELLSFLVKFFIHFKHFGIIDINIFEEMGEALKDINKIKNCMYDATYAALNFLKLEYSITDDDLNVFIESIKYNFINNDNKEKFTFEHYFGENNLKDNSIFIHEKLKGVIKTSNSVNYNQYTLDILNKGNIISFCQKLNENPELIKKCTIKKNYCAIITDGTAVLGFGNIGGKAGLPVMEGKSVLFKSLGGVNVIPLCFRQMDINKLIGLIEKISISFTAINLEDIKSPECFTVEKYLIDNLDIPVFHDDQHGTAIVVLAALINACKLAKKDNRIKDTRVIINGAGAAGLTICRIMDSYGFKNMIVFDSRGAIYEGRKEGMNPYKVEISKFTNKNKEKGQLKDLIKGSEIFVGVSVKDVLKAEDVKKMGEKPIIFALANPIPEILPDEAKKGGAFIVATGRSDFPNQVNNSLAFPGLFRAIVEFNLPNITEEIKLASALGLAKIIKDEEITVNNIITNSLNTDASLKIKDEIKKIIS